MAIKISTYTSERGGYLVRVKGKTLFICDDNGGENWRETTRAELRRDYPNDAPLWAYLKRRGIAKPTSGPSGKTQSHADKKAAGLVQWSRWLPGAVLGRLRELADAAGITEVEMFSRLVSGAYEAIKKKK